MLSTGAASASKIVGQLSAISIMAVSRLPVTSSPTSFRFTRPNVFLRTLAQLCVPSAPSPNSLIRSPYSGLFFRISNVVFFSQSRTGA